jgi:hypothetical protein
VGLAPLGQLGLHVGASAADLRFRHGGHRRRVGALANRVQPAIGLQVARLGDDGIAGAAGGGGLGRGVYNIGGGSRVSINQVLEMIGRITGRTPDIRREAAQKGDMRDTFADTSRARADLGFAPKTSLEAGIQAECEWLAGLLNVK